MEGQYASRRLTTLRAAPLDSYFLGNISIVGRDLVPGLTFTAAVRNLLDVRYQESASIDHVQNAIPQLGRTFWIGLGFDLDLESRTRSTPRQ